MLQTVSLSVEGSSPYFQALKFSIAFFLVNVKGRLGLDPSEYESMIILVLTFTPSNFLSSSSLIFSSALDSSDSSMLSGDVAADSIVSLLVLIQLSLLCMFGVSGVLGAESCWLEGVVALCAMIVGDEGSIDCGDGRVFSKIAGSELEESIAGERSLCRDDMRGFIVGCRVPRLAGLADSRLDNCDLRKA